MEESTCSAQAQEGRVKTPGLPGMTIIESLVALDKSLLFSAPPFFPSVKNCILEEFLYVEFCRKYPWISLFSQKGL